MTTLHLPRGQLWLEVDREVYHAGDTITATIHITGMPDSPLTTHLPSPAGLQTPKPIKLVVGSIQLVGQLGFDERVIDHRHLECLRNTPGYVSGSEGSFGGGSLLRGEPSSNQTLSLPVYSSPPSIIFINLQVEPTTHHKFECCIPIHAMAIPSHTGRAVRIFYRLIAGVSTPRQSVSTESIIRIMPPVDKEGFVNGFYRIQRPILIFDDLVKVRDGGKRSFKENAFGIHQEMISEEALPVHLDVRAGDVALGKIFLPRSTWFLGEMLTGLVEFEAGDSICIYQIKIDLELLEEIGQAFLLKPDQPGWQEKRTVCSVEQVCWMQDALPFYLSIPQELTPTLCLDLCTVSWCLRVHLWCADPKATHGLAPQISLNASSVLSSPTFLRQSPDIACVECFNLEVPLTILPPSLPSSSSSSVERINSVAIPES